MSSHYSILVNDQTAERLDRMLATGLWGDDRDGVLEQLVMAGVREAIATGLIDLDPKEFDEVDEPAVMQTAPEVDRLAEIVLAQPTDGKPACQTCKNGTDIADFECPNCGRTIF